MNDKVHLDHAHVRHLLTAMLRIRRFEEKCFELYQGEKIRGFMHLYDGEEAVSVGVIGGVATAGRRHLSRAWPGTGTRHRHECADG
jgi:pyruvate dehydrogenase E1 component alpha subunit